MLNNFSHCRPRNSSTLLCCGTRTRRRPIFKKMLAFLASFSKLTAHKKQLRESSGFIEIHYNRTMSIQGHSPTLKHAFEVCLLNNASLLGLVITNNALGPKSEHNFKTRINQSDLLSLFRPKIEYRRLSISPCFYVVASHNNQKSSVLYPKQKGSIYDSTSSLLKRDLHIWRRWQNTVFFIAIIYILHYMFTGHLPQMEMLP